MTISRIKHHTHTQAVISNISLLCRPHTYGAPEPVQDNVQDSASDDCGYEQNQHEDTEHKDYMVANQQIHNPDSRAACAVSCTAGCGR